MHGSLFYYNSLKEHVIDISSLGVGFIGIEENNVN
jgi:hypothetical protein